MKEIEIEVGGMTCEHCAARVNKSVREVKGVREARTALKENISYIIAEDYIEIEALKTAIEDAGYAPGAVKIADKNR